eukprot:3704629-Amphidinium_carterae.1
MPLLSVWPSGLVVDAIRCHEGLVPLPISISSKNPRSDTTGVSDVSTESRDQSKPSRTGTGQLEVSPSGCLRLEVALQTSAMQSARCKTPACHP